MENRWALVTGASVGLGREFALQLAANGYNLVLVSRDGEALERVADSAHTRWGVSTEILPANLLDPDERQGVVARLRREESPIDMLVNNAGFGVSGQLHDTDWSVEKDHLDIHVTVPLHLTHQVVPGMRQRGRGRVIVVSSVAAFLSRGAYSAAKRYWVTMAKSLTASYRSENVAVTAVCPGFTRTEFHQRMGMETGGIPRFAWLSAERVVSQGLRDSFRGQAVSIPTRRYRGFARLAPLIPARFHRLGE